MRVPTRFQQFCTAVPALAVASVMAVAMPAAAQSGGQVVIRATHDGQPVVDLKAADVSLRIDGKAREVRNLELVQPTSSTAAPAVPAAAAPAASSLPAPYTTNAAAGPALPKGAREFVIAIDDEGIAPGREQPVRAAVDALLKSLSPGDAVGLAGLKSGGVRLNATTDFAAVREALAKIVAMGSTSESENDMGCRTKTVIASLSALFEGAAPSRTIVVFSPGVATPTGESVRTKLGTQTDAMAAMCQVHQRDLDALGRVAGTSPAGLYVVFVPEAIANPANRATGEAGLENIAGVTGGEMLRLVGTGAAVERIARTAGTYYLATVDGAVADTRRIDARVNRDGIHVVARPVIDATATAGKAATPRDMIRTAAKFTALPLRSSAYVSRQQGSNDLKVIVLFEPDAPATKIASAAVGLFDEKGSLKAQWTARPEELARSPVIAALAAPPGTYRMRVAAADSDGKGGTTDATLDVRLTDAAPLTLATMVLVGSKGMSDPKLAFTADDAVAIGVLEMYGVAKDAKVDVMFEIARDVTGEAMGSGQGTVAAGQGEDARLAYGGFPLATLEPGDYVMRAVVKVDGKDAGVATRTLRKLK